MTENRQVVKAQPTALTVKGGPLCQSVGLWLDHERKVNEASASTVTTYERGFKVFCSWLASNGGLYMAWYLPLLILTVFRPNLDDRVALSAVQPVWRRKG